MMIRYLKYVLYLILILACVDSDLYSQNNAYKIKKRDHLHITFWDSPNLNTQSIVGNDGGIDIPVIGRNVVVGLSVDQLKERIVSQMALYNKIVSQISIVILDYGSNRIYVTGQVARPGRYSFEEIPGLWGIILEAGGHLQTAYLDEVTIVRTEGNGSVFTVDLSKALREGKLNSLPEIYPGDTISIPGATLTGLSQSPLVEKDEVYILGAVGTPGIHKLVPNLTIVEAIANAGGPIEIANLKKVRYVSSSGGRNTKVMEFNLESYFERSSANIITLKAGDTIYVPWKKKLSTFWSTLLITVMTTTITAFIVASVQK